VAASAGSGVMPAAANTSWITAFATNLKQGRHLRKGVTLEQARDVLWTCCAVELYELLVVHRGWSPKRDGEFAAAAAVAALL